MKIFNFSFSGGKHSAIEICLMCFALLFVMSIGNKISTNIDDGQSRWQKDIAGGGIEIYFLRDEDFLIDRWCRRDFKHIQNWIGSRANQVCRNQTEGILNKSAQDESSSKFSPEETVKRWQFEAAARANQWRNFFSSNLSQDYSVIVLSELSRTEYADARTNAQISFERQAVDELLQKMEIFHERLRRWDEWQRDVLNPAIKAPASKAAAEVLIKAAQSLDGTSNDAIGQLVRQLLNANQNASRATQAAALLNNLYAVLVGHWLLTWILTLLLRWRLSLFYLVNCNLLLALVTWVGFYYLGIALNPLDAPYWLTTGCIVMIINWCLHTFFATKQSTPQFYRPFSCWVLPGWWFFSALGWLLVLDQSLHFHPRNRFLVLEQWQAWWVATWILPFAAQTASPVAKVLTKMSAHWFQPYRWDRHFLHLLVSIFLVIAMYTANQLKVPSYVTGEILKLMFVLAISSWCIWRLPSVSNLWYGGLQFRALIQAGQVFWIVFVAAAISTVTHDKGPLLVICMIVVVLFSSMVGWGSGLLMLGIGFLLIFLVGVDLDVVGSRLQAWRDPFSADHDDMARLMWFQSLAAEHVWGFGPGSVPWCGTSSLDQCRGLPLQLQSDYTFTSIVGWWGLPGAILLLISFILFCFHMIVHSSRCNQHYMQPLVMLDASKRIVAIKNSLLFFTGTLLLLQAWITAAGNTGWLPLTGLTWPLLSFGKSSLWVTTWLLGSWGFETDHA